MRILSVSKRLLKVQEFDLKNMFMSIRKHFFLMAADDSFSKNERVRLGQLLIEIENMHLKIISNNKLLHIKDFQPASPLKSIMEFGIIEGELISLENEKTYSVNAKSIETKNTIYDDILFPSKGYQTLTKKLKYTDNYSLLMDNYLKNHYIRRDSPDLMNLTLFQSVIGLAKVMTIVKFCEIESFDIKDKFSFLLKEETCRMLKEYFESKNLLLNGNYKKNNSLDLFFNWLNYYAEAAEYNKTPISLHFGTTEIQYIINARKIMLDDKNNKIKIKKDRMKELVKDFYKFFENDNSLVKKENKKDNFIF